MKTLKALMTILTLTGFSSQMFGQNIDCFYNYGVSIPGHNTQQNTIALTKSGDLWQADGPEDAEILGEIIGPESGTKIEEPMFQLSIRKGNHIVLTNKKMAALIANESISLTFKTELVGNYPATSSIVAICIGQ